MNKGRWDGTVIRWQHLETEFNIGGEVGGKRIETNDPANVEQFNIQRTRRGRFTSRRVRIVGKSPASIRSTDLALLPPAPFFRHPFHPARFVNSEIYSKRDRNVYGRGDRFVSSSLPPLSPRGAWILGSTSLLPREFKIPVTGLHRRREEEEEEEGGRNIPPFRVEHLNILRCCSPTRPIRRRFSFAEEKEGGARRKTKARKETKGKEGRKEERRTTRRVSLMERN